MNGRLNTFQKSMLQWNDLHAYNAIHVVRVSGELEVNRLQGCIHATLEKRGLTFLTLDRSTNSFQYEGGPVGSEIQVIENSSNATGALVGEMERQLNRPFPCHERFCPFRFLIVPATGSFFLGLVYFHPAADAESVVLLLTDIVDSHLQRDRSGFSSSPELYPDSRSHLLRRHFGVVVRRLLGLPGQIVRLRRSYRAEHRDAGDMTNGFVFFKIGHAELAAMLRTAQSWGVTFNDLLMALLMKSLSPCAPGRTQARRRNRISLGCIVNTRGQIDVDSGRAFGLFLGSFVVTHEVPEGIALRKLAADLSDQTAMIKRHRHYLGTALELGFARFVFRFSSPRQRRTFYLKNWPLLGGITNMNLNALWEQSEDGVPLDYFRGVSTGPITPLVLSVTTVGSHANIGLSFRHSVFTAAEIEALKCRFLDHLGEIRRHA